MLYRIISILFVPYFSKIDKEPNLAILSEFAMARLLYQFCVFESLSHQLYILAKFEFPATVVQDLVRKKVYLSRVDLVSFFTCPLFS